MREDGKCIKRHAVLSVLEQSVYTGTEGKHEVGKLGGNQIMESCQSIL